MNIQVRKVKDKGYWKDEGDMRSPEETDEAAALRSLTFTLNEEKKDTIKEIIPVFNDLNDLELVDLPLEYLIMVIRALLCLCREERNNKIASEEIMKRLEIAIDSLATSYDLLVGMEATISKLRIQMKEDREEQDKIKKEIIALKKENASKTEAVKRMEEDKYKMGDRHKNEKKKTAEEITKLKLDNSRVKADANEKINENKRLGRKVTALEKNTDLKDRIIELKGDDEDSHKKEIDKLKLDIAKGRSETDSYKTETKKKEEMIRDLKAENDRLKHEEDKIWQMNRDQLDKIAELSEEIMERNTKIVETED